MGHRTKTILFKTGNSPGRQKLRDIRTAKGTLMMIGGHEDKTSDCVILKTLAREARGGKLVIASVASDVAEEMWQQYRTLFLSLGVKHVVHLNIAKREEVFGESQLKVLEDAKVVFFTGGDQLRITTKLGGSQIADRIRDVYIDGGMVAGTSAGASVMSEVMLVSGPGSESYRVGSSLLMACGLGLIREMIIDQHFAQRGRIGRLLGAIAQNPGVLGIGIDEDTAIIVRGNKFEVLGSGAVYICDGRKVSYSTASEKSEEKTMSLFDAKIHVLAHPDAFDLLARRPLSQESSRRPIKKAIRKKD